MKIPQILTLILNLTLAQTIAQTGVKKEKGTQEWKPLKCLISKLLRFVAGPGIEPGTS